MEEVSEIFVTAVPESQFIRPARVHYKQAGEEKTWDLLQMYDTVAVVVFNVERKCLVFNKQFRPAIYYNTVHARDRKDSTDIDVEKYPAELGISLELCAGMIEDTDRSLQEIVQAELMEKMGFDVPTTSLQKIMSYRSGVGIHGALQTLFYCEVTDAMKVGKGGGKNSEIIELVEKSIPEVERMLLSLGPHPSPPSCMFGIMWFMQFKAKTYRKSFERYCVECKYK